MRLHSFLSALAALLVTAAVAGTAGAMPELGGPLVSGTSAMVDGTFVWTDYAYDDRGANTNAIFGGDEAYPPAPHPGNTADFIQLQVGNAVGGGVHVTALLETLVPGYDAHVGVGFDTDGSSLTGAPGVPGGGWLPQAPNPGLGLEWMAVLESDTGSGTLFEWQLTAWVAVGSFSVTVDRVANTISADLAALTPGTATWRTVGLVGRADGSGSWVGGVHPIQDLAFVVGEDPVTDPAISLYQQVPQIYQPWQDNIQSDILAGIGDPEPAFAAISFGTAQNSAPPPIDPSTPGIYTFLYHSVADFGEGQANATYSGAYMPYVVYITSQLTEDPPPAVVFMHGANQNHLVNSVHFSLEGLTIDGAYDVPAVVIFPIGRTSNWNTPEAEQDLLESTDDAIARLGLDAERIVLSGISAGGIGTFRHLARYPDKWTGGYSIVGGGTTTLENMHNVPLRFHNGTLDPLVNVAFWQDSVDAANAAGTVDFRGVLVNTSSHIPEEAGNCWYLEMLATPRAVDPARVRYTVLPAQFAIDPARNLDLHPDGAYWVSDMVSNDANPASIDATSRVRADRLRVATDIVNELGENASQSADFCGPNPDPDYQTGDEWITQGRAFAAGTAQPIEKRLTATLTNLAQVTLDVARAGLVPAGGNVGDWDGDGVADGSDNCPWVANADQADSGGLATSTPDGVGDACQCGDVTDNGVVNGQDGNAMRRYGLGLTPNPVFRAECKCDVTGNGLCNGQDGTTVIRESLGLASAFDGAQCDAFTGRRVVDLDTDGPSLVTLTGLTPGTQVELDGSPVGSAAPDGSVTTAVPAGQHTIALLP